MRYIREWIALVIFLLVIAAFLTLLVIQENDSGTKASLQAKGELEGAGLSWETQQLNPPLPNPSKNFAAIPMIAALADFDQPKIELTPADKILIDEFEVKYRQPRNRARFVAIKLPIGSGPLPDWQENRFCDFEEIVKKMSENGGFESQGKGAHAENILSALTNLKPVITNRPWQP